MNLSERLKQERAFVEAKLAGKIICDRCECTLGEFADKCTAGLSDGCPGFMAIEQAKDEFRTKGTGDGKG